MPEAADLLLKIVLLGLLLTAWGHSIEDSHVGSGINIFKFFGDLSLTMRVAPRNDTQPWLFRDHQMPVFKYTKTKSLKRELKGPGRYQLEICDNLDKLMKAYFEGVRIEGIDESWKAVAKGWSPRTTARRLGISEAKIRSSEGAGYGFLLIRVNSPGERLTLKKTGEVTDAVKTYVEGLDMESPQSINNFLTDVGSHYVSSYMTGDSIFQVLVYQPSTYRHIKRRLGPSGVNSVSPEELNNIFSPLLAVEVGQIMVMSGNSTITQWARDTFTGRSGLVIYPSLLSLRRRPQILPQLKEMMNGHEALLRLKLSFLDVLFTDKAKKLWFKEVVINQLKLYESNV